ncbi:MAG: hypothetical protein OXB97_04600 [Rhodospirillales bacterium]|nr:hypothetical protein [Rhodospirillales bacterium]
MAITDGDRHRFYAELTAAAGESDIVVLDIAASSIAVQVHPGAGGSAVLSTSCRSIADVEAGNASWIDVQIGASTALAGDSGAELPAAITAVRLTAVGAEAIAHLAALA